MEFKKVYKRFSGVTVLNDINFSVNKGEVHCIVGENGAGKSTLMKILSGVYSIDEGEIYLENKKVLISSPFIAKNMGIATVHQELNVIENLNIEENMTLGREFHKAGFIQRKGNISRIKRYLDEVELNIPINTKLKFLSTGQKQMITIAKALSMETKILILDEPTAALSEVEADNLFKRIRELKAKGVTIIYISHRMKEIFDIGDRVTILKDGSYVCTKDIKDTNQIELAEKMVGRELKTVFPPVNTKLGETVLEVKNLSTDKLHNINFKVRKGEVLGISGIVGSGRTEVLRAVFGADKIIQGEIILNGKKVKISNPTNSINNKIAFIPEDRRKQAIIKVMPVRDNLVLIFNKFNHFFGFINKRKADVIVEKYVNDLSIKLASPTQKIQYLSGGNQQKVVLSKWLCIDSEVLLLDEPTQGVDIGAKQDIYQLISQLALDGKTIIIVSSEMVELLNLCNTLIIMRNGKIVGGLSADEANEELIIKAVMGVVNNE
ncbi:MAG TPA: sugar ABC transporter ATP-binding protein [Ruminiclostridium sp.]